MSSDTSNLFIEYMSGGYIYLPEYMRIFREVEHDVINHIHTVGGQEVMLPKLLKMENIDSLKCCDKRFEEEWEAEQLRVSGSGNNEIGVLAHWQCEPIYPHLAEIFENVVGGEELKIIFDNSGYSYRLESNNHIFRPNEFRRIEVFFHGNILSVRSTMHKLLDFLVQYLDSYNAFRVERPEESYDGKEQVEDVVVMLDGKEIEVAGSHIHFDTFSAVVTSELNDRVVTACCGISLSRLTSLIAICGNSANKNVNTDARFTRAGYV